MPRDFAADYVTVAERIDAFHKKYPEGSIQSEVLTLNDHEVLVKAEAYRTPTDPRPGIGHSWLGIPGSTPYTRGSEVENAETSAWGRALAALGFEVKKGIASNDEVQNKQGDQRPARQAPAPQQRPQQAAPRPVARDTAPPAASPQRPPSAVVVNGGEGMSLRDALQALEGVEKRAIGDAGKELYGTWSLKEMSPQQRAGLVAHLIGGGTGPVPPVPPPSQLADDDDWGGLLDGVKA